MRQWNRPIRPRTDSFLRRNLMKESSEIKNLNLRIEELERDLLALRQEKTRLTKQNSELASELNKQKEDFVTQSSKLEDDCLTQKSLNEQLRQENSDLKKKVSDLSQEKENLLEKKKEIEESYKDHLISSHLGGSKRLNEKDLEFVIEIYEVEKLKRQAVLTPEKPIVNPYSESYLKSLSCVCGNEKKIGAKGCPECKQEAERIRKRESVGAVDAWKEVWKSLGIQVEEHLEEERF